MIKPLSSILIKPAGPSCNLNCDYCFYLKKKDLFEGNDFKMSESTLEELIRQAMEQSGNEINFLWQGGEPTLMGLDFFKLVIEYQIKYGKGKTVGNGLQTNGTLLDHKWIPFLAKHNFLVGLSIDGPEKIHDHYRKYKNKKGSWKQVMESYLKMKEAGIAVNAMATLTKYSANSPLDTYDFFKKLELDFIQFIPVFETNSQGIEDFSVSAEAYGNFLVKIWRLWLQDFMIGKAPNIRTFEAIFGNYVGTGASECTFSNECGNYLVVEHNGDVFSCDFFVEPEWKLGNISTHSLKSMLNSAKQKRFGLQKTFKNSECKNCVYYPYCNAGCLKYRVLQKNGEPHNFFCKAYKQFFKEAHPILLNLAKQWKEDDLKNNQGKTFDATGYF